MPRLERPSQTLSAPSITDLPCLEYDAGWNHDEWEHHFYDASYAIRFLRSRFRPLLALDNDPHGRELEQLSAALISRFISITKSDGTIPLPVSAVPWPGTDCYC